MERAMEFAAVWVYGTANLMSTSLMVTDTSPMARDLKCWGRQSSCRTIISNKNQLWLG